MIRAARGTERQRWLHGRKGILVFRTAADFLIRISRRRLLTVAVAGTVQNGSAAQAQSESSVQPLAPRLLLRLEPVPIKSVVLAWELTLYSGQVWTQRYPGPVAIRVKEGVMTIPSAVEHPLPVSIISHLNISGESATAEWTTGPDFPAGFGVFVPDGDIGSIENRQAEPLRLFLLESRPAGWKGEMPAASRDE